MNNYIKYPRTFHLPWSEGCTNDDRQLSDTTHFYGRQVVVLEKLDGENCLDGNSIIKTQDGYKTIRQICQERYNDDVLSFNEDVLEEQYASIKNHIITEQSDDWYQIQLENGEIIRITGKHRVYLPQLRCYRMVRDLTGQQSVLVV